METREKKHKTAILYHKEETEKTNLVMLSEKKEILI